MKHVNMLQSMIYRVDRSYMMTRRMLDILIATLALIALSPILLIAVIAIKLEDRGPILFTQQRVGRFGKLFKIYKLRTMRVTECADAHSPTGKKDSRITRAGAFLRKTSIDELPQLVNVINGTMAIVGPRPEMAFIVKKYEKWQHLRHLATPGITGLWQTTCRSKVPLHMPEATMIDLKYIAMASHIADTKIIVKTFRSLAIAHGAY